MNVPAITSTRYPTNRTIGLMDSASFVQVMHMTMFMMIPYRIMPPMIRLYTFVEMPVPSDAFSYLTLLKPTEFVELFSIFSFLQIILYFVFIYIDWPACLRGLCCYFLQIHIRTAAMASTHFKHIFFTNCTSGRSCSNHSIQPYRCSICTPLRAAL